MPFAGAGRFRDPLFASHADSIGSSTVLTDMVSVRPMNYEDFR